MKSVVFFVALIAGAAVCGCGGASNPSDQTKAASSDSSKGGNYVASDAKGIQTMTVKTSSVPDYLELAAHIEADPTRVVHVFAPAGGRITELKVRPWERVDKGQTLALLQSSDLARAMADYQRAVADNEVKQKQLVRSQDLLAHRAIAERISSRRKRMRSRRRQHWTQRENKFWYSAWTPIKRARSCASRRRVRVLCSM